MNMRTRLYLGYIFIGATYIVVVCSILFGCHPMHNNWQIYPNPGSMFCTSIPFPGFSSLWYRILPTRRLPNRRVCDCHTQRRDRSVPYYYPQPGMSRSIYICLFEFFANSVDALESPSALVGEDRAVGPFQRWYLRHGCWDSAVCVDSHGKSFY